MGSRFGLTGTASRPAAIPRAAGSVALSCAGVGATYAQRTTFRPRNLLRLPHPDVALDNGQVARDALQKRVGREGAWKAKGLSIDGVSESHRGRPMWSSFSGAGQRALKQALTPITSCRRASLARIFVSVSRSWSSRRLSERVSLRLFSTM